MTFELPQSMGPFADHLGLKLVSAEPDKVVGTWVAGPPLHQPFGLVNGGAHCTVVETLASIAAAVWLDGRGQCVGVNNNTDFYRGISEGPLTSTATPLHRGRSQQVWVVETISDTDGKLIARGQVRIQNLYPQA